MVAYLQCFQMMKHCNREQRYCLVRQSSSIRRRNGGDLGTSQKPPFQSCVPSHQENPTNLKEDYLKFI